MTAMLFWLEEFSFVNCVTIIVSLSICPVSVPSGDVGNEKKKKTFSFVIVFVFFFVWIKFFLNFWFDERPYDWAAERKEKNTGSFVVINIDSPPFLLTLLYHFLLICVNFFFVLLLLVKKKKKLFIFGTHTHNPCNILDWPHTSPPFFFFSNYGNLLRTVYI
jgi:hypothetical protein